MILQVFRPILDSFQIILTSILGHPVQISNSFQTYVFWEWYLQIFNPNFPIPYLFFSNLITHFMGEKGETGEGLKVYLQF